MKHENRTDTELAVLLGFDAFRLAIGLTPTHFTPHEVVEGIRLCAVTFSRSTDTKTAAPLEGGEGN